MVAVGLKVRRVVTTAQGPSSGAVSIAVQFRRTKPTEGKVHESPVLPLVVSQ